MKDTPKRTRQRRPAHLRGQAAVKPKRKARAKTQRKTSAQAKQDTSQHLKPGIIGKNGSHLSEVEWNEAWVLDQKCSLRADKGRILCAKVDGTQLERGIITTEKGVVLALMDGKRTLRDLANVMSYLFDLPEEKAEESVEAFVASAENSGISLVRVRDLPPNTEIRKFDPAKLARAGSAFNTERRLKSPITITWMPTHRCATDCVYCYANRRPIGNRAMLSFRRIEQFIEEMIDLEINPVNLTGGDPFMHPRIFEILEMLIGAGISVDLPTKVPLSKKKVDRLAKIGITEMQFSIDGPNAEVCQLAVHKPEWFGAAIRTIRMLVDAGIKVRTNTILTPFNIKHAKETALLLHSLGVFQVKLTLYNRSIYRHSEALWVRKKDAEELAEGMDELRQACPGTELLYSSDVDWSEMSREEKKKAWNPSQACTAFTDALVVTPDGECFATEEMMQSEFFSLGSIAKNTIQEVWDSNRLMELYHPPRELFKGTVCYRCREFDECHYEYGYCFRDSFKAYGTFYGPMPNCPKAPKGRRCMGSV